MTAKLMAHQVAGVKFLRDMDGVAALLFEPGVGKTGTTLAWVDRQVQLKADKEFRVLVIAPLTAADTWVLQASMFMKSTIKARMLQGSTLKIMDLLKKSGTWATVPITPIMVDRGGNSAKVTIASMSAGAVSSWCTERTKTIQMLRAIRAYGPDLIVVDESHIIKSPTANISKAMYQIGQLAKHRIILTGTVEPNSPLDVYGQWRFLAPWTFSDQHGEDYTNKPTEMTRAEQEAVRPWPFGRFKTRYSTPGGYKGKGIGDYQNLDDLHARVAERSMVVYKKDALDLPGTSDIDIHVTLNAAERKAYDQMKVELAMELADGSLLEAPNALAKIMKLRQIAAGFVRDTATGEVHVVGKSLQKAAGEIASVQLAGEKRIVVFGYFRSECAALRDLMKKTGKRVELITGETKAADRLAIRQRFGSVSRNPEPTILVAQQRTMSLSVNELITAQHAIYTSQSERRADWVQSRGRLDRNGQTAPVTFWNCFTPGTVGEVMIQTHHAKGDMEKELLEHIRNTVR